MNILVTGYEGFIGKNLCSHLQTSFNCNLVLANRANFFTKVEEHASNINFIFHLAGENRAKEDKKFTENNLLNTKFLVETLQSVGNCCPIAFTSSSKITEDNIYGRTKKGAEEILIEYSKKNDAQVFIFRLPNIFGKWSKPAYNSTVATLINDLINNNETKIWDGNKIFKLLYIDDAIKLLVKCLNDQVTRLSCVDEFPIFKTNVNYLYKKIKYFHHYRKKGCFKVCHNDLEKKLYSTYLSYLNIKECVFPIKSFTDQRGSFTEFLKEPISGQVSIFTAYPNILRGDHYHHTKVERFLIASGTALFKFKHILSMEEHNVEITGEDEKVVETFPGWNHSIKNIGNDKMSGIIWSNEVFNKENPDTYINKVKKNDL